MPEVKERIVAATSVMLVGRNGMGHMPELAPLHNSFARAVMGAKRHPRCYQCGNRLGKRRQQDEICGECERGIEGAAFKRVSESELSATEEETLS